MEAFSLLVPVYTFQTSSEEILIEGTKLGQHKSYRLNAYYGWKGSTENHNDALERDPIPLSDRMKQSGIESVIDGGKKYK